LHFFFSCDNFFFHSFFFFQNQLSRKKKRRKHKIACKTHKTSLCFDHDGASYENSDHLLYHYIFFSKELEKITAFFRPRGVFLGFSFFFFLEKSGNVISFLDKITLFILYFFSCSPHASDSHPNGRLFFDHQKLGKNSFYHNHVQVAPQRHP
jgi:hypothetical protein